MPTLETTPQQALEDLLESCFTTSELERFLSGMPGGADLVRQLPGSGVAFATYVHEAAAALDRHGLVDDALFGALKRLRPRRVEEIEDVARRFAPQPLQVGPIPSSSVPLEMGMSSRPEQPRPEPPGSKARPTPPSPSKPTPDPRRELRLRIQGQKRELLGAPKPWSIDAPVIDWSAPLFGPDKKLTLKACKQRLPTQWGRPEILDFGTQLAGLLLDDIGLALFRAALENAADTTLRLILDLDPEAGQIPWEYLVIDKTPILERRVSIVRDVASIETPGPLQLGARPQPIALCSANPLEDGDRYDDGEHSAQIEAGLDGWTVFPRMRVNADSLLALARNEQARAFHFLGHGERGGLVVHARERGGALVSSPALAANLGLATQLQLVFLGACHSGEVAPNEDFAGVAAEIVRVTGRPVVAMQMAVPRTFSTAFARGFYENLKATDWDVEAAVHRTRRTTAGEQPAFGIPVLYADLRARPNPPELQEFKEKFQFYPVPVVVGSAERWGPVLEGIDAAARQPIEERLKTAQTEVPLPRADMSAAIRDLLLATSASVVETASAVSGLAASQAPRRPTIAPSVAVIPEGDAALKPDWGALERVKRALGDGFAVDDALVVRVLGELYAGRHVMLTGPVGTGKTTLARAVAQGLGYTPHLVTAHAEWSAFDLVGGHVPSAVRKEGSTALELVFQPGCFVEAILRNWETAPGQSGAVETWRRRQPGCWLIIDELNRADMDRALGGLFTVLGGGERSLRVPTTSERSGQLASFELPIPADFRVIATMNTVDRHYLFRLSDALKRRFAFVEIPVVRADQETQLLNPEDPVQADLHRFVQLARHYHPLGTAILLAGRRFLEVTAGAGLSDAERLCQAISGSVLPNLDDLPLGALQVLLAWAQSTDAEKLQEAMKNAEEDQVEPAPAAPPTRALPDDLPTLARELAARVRDRKL